MERVGFYVLQHMALTKTCVLVEANQGVYLRSEQSDPNYNI